MLDRAVGSQVAAAMSLCGEELDGEAAARVGMALRCVTDEELLAEAQRLAQRVASWPRQVTIDAKQSLGEMPQVDSYEEAIDIELARQLRSATTEEFARRMEALMQRGKKKP